MEATFCAVLQVADEVREYAIYVEANSYCNA